MRGGGGAIFNRCYGHHTPVKPTLSTGASVSKTAKEMDEEMEWRLRLLTPLLSMVRRILAHSSLGKEVKFWTPILSRISAIRILPSSS